MKGAVLLKIYITGQYFEKELGFNNNCHRFEYSVSLSEQVWVCIFRH